MIFQHCYFVLEVGGGGEGPGKRGNRGRGGGRNISLYGFVRCLKGLIPELAHGNLLLFILFP